MSNSVHIPDVPAGYSPPATVISLNDHSGWLVITTAIGLCVVLVFYAIRIYIRTVISPRFGRDDAVLSLATVHVFNFGMTACILPVATYIFARYV
jgi:hypothetical protein